MFGELAVIHGRDVTEYIIAKAQTHLRVPVGLFWGKETTRRSGKCWNLGSKGNGFGKGNNIVCCDLFLLRQLPRYQVGDV